MAQVRGAGPQLEPAGPDQLYEVSDAYIRYGGRVLDVGCRDAAHLIRLADRYRLSGVGVDPVPWHIDRARRAITEAGLDERLTVRLGTVEDLTDPDEAFDLLWCRDVVEVLPDLDVALGQVVRVPAPGGAVVVFTNVLHGPVDDEETRLVHRPLGNVVANLVEADLERAFADRGLTITEKVVDGTQWGEYLEERDHLVSRDLLGLASWAGSFP